MSRAIPEQWEARNGWDFWLDYDSGVWEADTHAWITERVLPGSTYLDIGAWIGPTVLWAAPIASRVIAVEPDPAARRCLLANTALLPNVEVVAGAIGPSTGMVPFYAHTKEGWGSSMSRLSAPDRTWDTDNPETVLSFTLPTLFERWRIQNVSLVKMDIEGGEAEILESVCPFLAERKIPLLVSLHKDWWAQPVERSWFDCFSEVLGEWAAPTPILALP